MRGAHREHLLFLEHAKKRCLRRERQIADFVEQQRPFLAAAHQAGPILRRTREGALAIPEQLGFDEGRWQRAAIDGEEGARAAGDVVDGGRDHFFPGARLAPDQDRHARARHEHEALQLRAEHRRQRRKPRCRRTQLARIEKLGAAGRERLTIEQEAVAELEYGAIGERRAADSVSVQPGAVLGSRVLDHPVPQDSLYPRVRRGHARVGDSDPEDRHLILLMALDREGVGAPDRHHVCIVKAEARAGLNGTVAAKHQEQVRLSGGRWRRPFVGAADRSRRFHSPAL